MDRRVAVGRIARVKRELARVQSQRTTMRKHRSSVPIPTGAIVGYTNAGKSSLLNALTRSEVLAENKLFATLDPTTRRLSLPNGREVLLTDTVGFIRRLPHDLVHAFHSTLEETILADFLIDVVDGSSANRNQEIAVTRQVLEDIGAGGKPVIMVLNKMDLRTPPLAPAPGTAVEVSARTGSGLDRLLAVIGDMVANSAETEIAEFLFPATRHDLAAFLHRTGRVLSKNYVDGFISMRAQVSTKTCNMLAEYRQADHTRAET